MSAAQSSGFGNIVEKAAWIRMAQQEVEAARVILNENPMPEFHAEDYWEGGNTFAKGRRHRKSGGRQRKRGAKHAERNIRQHVRQNTTWTLQNKY